jgi:hypothetical protein
MAVHGLAVATSEHWNFEARLADAATYAGYGGVILSGIVG